MLTSIRQFFQHRKKSVPNTLEAPTSHGICSVCMVLFEGELEVIFFPYTTIKRTNQVDVKTPSPKHHATIESLYSSVEKYCWICTRLWLSLAGDWDLDLSSRLSLASKERRDEVQSAMREQMLVTEEPLISLDSDQWEQHEGPDFKFSWKYTTSDGETKAGSLAFTTMPLHPDPPTRLLQLDKAEAGAIKLIETEGHKHIRYCSLSHCWGGANIKKLEEATRASFYEGIAISELPLTFRHAIKVALSLGVGYLWIDSLCIIQDSVEDWRFESSRMGDVYKNAVCNIAATSSTSSHGGLFHERIPSLTTLGRVQTRWTTKDIDNRELLIEPQEVSTNDALNQLPVPLLTRAWVLQERVLAPRTLHFSPYQLYWECYEDEFCETHPRGLSKGRGEFKEKSDLGKAFFKKSCPRFHYDSVRGDLEPLYQQNLSLFWREMITRYSRLGLTKGTDKLIAISGIVKEVQKLTRGQYAAGLWLNDPLAFSWQLSRRRNLSEYRAPSWS